MSNPLLFNNTLQRSTNQRVPLPLKYRTESSVDVIQQRTQVKLVPISGDLNNYGSGVGTASNRVKSIKIRLKSDDFIDSESIKLRFHAQMGGDNWSYGASRCLQPPDGASGLISSIRVSLNSQELESLSQYGVLVSMLGMSSYPNSWYQKQGDFEGYWKLRRKNGMIGYGYTGSADNPPTQAQVNDVAALANAVHASQYNFTEAIVNRYHGGWDVSLQLHCGIFRTGTFLPPSVPIDLELTLADVNDCCAVLGSGAGAGDLQNYYYNLSNVRLIYDQIKLHPSYVQRFNQQVQTSGVPLELDTYQMIENVMAPSTVNTMLLSRGVSRLRTVYGVMMDAQPDLASTSKVDGGFMTNAYKRHRFTLNGVSYPNDYSEGYSEAYNNLQEAMGDMNDLNARDMLDWGRYTGDQSGFDPVPAGNPGANAAFREGSYFIIGQDFQRSLTSRASGIDSASQGGVIQWNLDTNANIPANTVARAFLHFDKGINIESGAVVISE